jgi:uncharacterized protein (DUF1330 family)
LAIEPTEAQLETLRNWDPAEPLALIRLLKVRDAEAFAAYGRVLGEAVAAGGGTRAYEGDTGPGLSPPGANFDVLWIDEFPSRELCAESMRSPNPHAKEALEDAFVVAARPASSLFMAAIRAAAAVLRTVARVRLPADVPAFPSTPGGPAVFDDPDLAIEPSAESAATFMDADQDAPMAMINFNRARERAVYKEPVGGASTDVSGRQAYLRYARVVLPMVMRRGGRPIWSGGVSEIVIGAETDALFGGWDDFALVYYPSRRHMRDMLAHAKYEAVTPHREAGLEGAGTIPTSPAPAFLP